MAQDQNRFIELQGCVNFRDLGGYRNRQGKTVAWRKVFRSDSLHLMTDEDTKHVYQTMGVASLIDLRNSTEMDRDGYESTLPTTVNYLSLSFLELHGIDPFELGDDPASRLAETYLWILNNSGHLVGEALNALAQQPNRPSLFHCTAGKDRTGVLAAMLLSILDVDEEQIMADYELTNLAMDRLYPLLCAIPGNETRPRTSFQAQPKAMEAFLSALRNDHSGAQEYATTNGVSTENIDILRASLLV